MSINYLLYLGVSIAAALALAGTFLAIAWSIFEDTSGGPARRSASGVALASLKDASLLSGGNLFEITVYRQSGYVHSQYSVADAASAVAKATTTFTRARIETVELILNTPNELHFAKVSGGSVRGKGVGSVVIKRLT